MSAHRQAATGPNSIRLPVYRCALEPTNISYVQLQACIMPIVPPMLNVFAARIGLQACYNTGTGLYPTLLSLCRYATVHRRRNEAIGAESIILIDEKGLNHGLKNCKAVLTQLNRGVYDLVEMSQKDNVSVCKIMPIEQPSFRARSDLALSKKTGGGVGRGQNEAAPAPPKSKEMNFSSAIAAHDYTRKVNQTKEFLAKGYLVQLSITGKESNDLTDKERQEGGLKKTFYTRLMKDLHACGLLKGPVRQSAYQWSWTMLGHKKETIMPKEGESEREKEPNRH